MLPPKIHIWETFPIHPQPHPGEALSSYLGRLMAANGIVDQRRMLDLCFPYLLSRPTIDQIDLGAVPLAFLASLTECAESRLVALTFAPLVARLGLDLQSRTLRNDLTDSQHFCPACLVEHPWHRLIWRFDYIRGCLDHNCTLIKRCRQCSSLFSPLNPIPGQCQQCGRDHRGVAVATLTPEDRRTAERYVHDLTYLLTPVHEPTWQVQDMVRQAGRHLAVRRQAARLYEEDIAPFLSCPVEYMGSYEEGRIRSRRSITTYFEYAHFLGLTMQTLFEPSGQALLTDIRQGRAQLMADMHRILADLKNELQKSLKDSRDRRQPTDDPVLQAIDNVGEILAAQGRLTNSSSICEITGMSWEALHQYPGGSDHIEHALVEARRRSHYHSRCDTVIKVVMAIFVLRSARRPVSLTRVAQILKCKPDQVRYFPEIADLIRKASMLQFPDEVSPETSAPR